MDFSYWFGNCTKIEAPPNISWTALWEVYWFILDNCVARLAVLALQDQYFAHPDAAAVFFVDHLFSSFLLGFSPIILKGTSCFFHLRVSALAMLTEKPK